MGNFESKIQCSYILMYAPGILYSLLSRPTKAQHTYINNILYIVSIPICFDASASSSGSLLSFYFAKVIKIIKVTNPIKSTLIGFVNLRISVTLAK